MNASNQSLSTWKDYVSRSCLQIVDFHFFFSNAFKVFPSIVLLCFIEYTNVVSIFICNVMCPDMCACLSDVYE